MRTSEFKKLFGISQEEFAQRCCLSRQCLYGITKGNYTTEATKHMIITRLNELRDEIVKKESQEVLDHKDRMDAYIETVCDAKTYWHHRNRLNKKESAE